MTKLRPDASTHAMTSNGHRPRKELGQHFLHHQGVIDHIIRHFDPKPSDTVIEIGPGHGALTYRLLSRVRVLHAIELDANLAAMLARRSDGESKLCIHHGDALQMDVCALAGGGEVRLIGNLPYNISTPLLFHLLPQRSCIRDMCFMLQREVAERLQAAPGSKRYGRLSVMIQQCCRVESVLSVDRDAFTPRPEVESMVLNLVPYSKPPFPVHDPRAFAELVRVAFSQRRKTLRNALKPLLSAERIRALGIDPGLRPEQLSVEDYVRLSGSLS